MTRSRLGGSLDRFWQGRRCSLLPPLPMYAGAPPSSPYPRSSRVVAPLDSLAMPSPPPASPAAAEDEVRPLLPMKIKLFPYAMYCLFGGMGHTGDILFGVFVGIYIHYLHFIVRFLALYTDGELALFLTLVISVVASLIFAATALITSVFIHDYMRVDGVYHVEFDPPQQQTAAELLPPPPPEMDMC